MRFFEIWLTTCPPPISLEEGEEGVAVDETLKCPGVLRFLVRGQPFSGTGALPVADAEGIKMLYISLATITTLGNSDIAVTFLARQMATIEAITGQLYLAVLIARLVGFSSAAAPPPSGND
jgi:hypothetical protein